MRQSRSCQHDHSSLSPLCRKNRPYEKHGSLLCHVHRAKSVWRSVPDATLGTYRNERPNNKPSFRNRTRSGDPLSRSPASEEGPRLLHRCTSKRHRSTRTRLDRSGKSYLHRGECGVCQPTATLATSSSSVQIFPRAKSDRLSLKFWPIGQLIGKTPGRRARVRNAEPPFPTS